jgi:hypothetical protein
MRYVIFFSVLLISISQVFAGDSSLDKYCGPNSPPQVCLEYTDAALKEYSRSQKANEENTPVLNFCMTTKDPSGCIETYRTNQPNAYALEIARMEQQLALEKARHSALLREIERRKQAER